MAEAVRAATLTIHAAAGLVRHGDQQAVRMLRAAEGLCRAALVVLLAPTAAPSPHPPTATQAGEAPRVVVRGRRRRPRGKRGRGSQKDAETDEKRNEPGAKEDAPAGAAPGQPPELDDAWADLACQAEAQPPAPTALRDTALQEADLDHLDVPFLDEDAAPPVVAVPLRDEAGPASLFSRNPELERLRQQPGFRDLFSPS